MFRITFFFVLQAVICRYQYKRKKYIKISDIFKFQNYKQNDEKYIFFNLKIYHLILLTDIMLNIKKLYSMPLTRIN